MKTDRPASTDTAPEWETGNTQIELYGGRDCYFRRDTLVSYRPGKPGTRHRITLDTRTLWKPVNSRADWQSL